MSTETSAEDPDDLIAAIRRALAVMEERKAILRARLDAMREQPGPYARDIIAALTACDQAEAEFQRLVRLYGDMATADSARG